MASSFNKYVNEGKIKSWFRISVLKVHRKAFYKSRINLDTKSFVRGNRATAATALDINDDEHVQQMIRDMQEDEQPIPKLDTYQDISVA